VAEVRLERACAGFGDGVRLQRHPYILKLEENPHASFSYDRRGHWMTAARAEPGLVFNLWTGGERYPVSSLSALIAARAGERQGADAGDRYHWALFRAFFEGNRDISNPHVLRDVASGVGLDLVPFDADLADPALREEVLAAHLEAVDSVRVEAVPTVIVGAQRFEGASPEAAYRAALAGVLARS
jgi:predicted DsbA family dithiol-disulfide isomerase